MSEIIRHVVKNAYILAAASAMLLLEIAFLTQRLTRREQSLKHCCLALSTSIIVLYSANICLLRLAGGEFKSARLGPEIAPVLVWSFAFFLFAFVYFAAITIWPFHWRPSVQPQLVLKRCLLLGVWSNCLGLVVLVAYVSILLTLQ